MTTLGVDTSNYTTSVAVFDGTDGCNVGRLLDVPAGALGLRQSEALFQHVKRLPELMQTLAPHLPPAGVDAVGASTRPRTQEGSYMPCFLAGNSVAQSLAAVQGVPFFAFSHQQGHLAAAAWSCGREELLDGTFLAWHLSGGTTELLLVECVENEPIAKIIGGTTDISAGQLIDRAGVLLGLDFPAGKALDALYDGGAAVPEGGVKLRELSFSLSGMENKVKAMAERGCPKGDVARFVLDTVASAVVRTTEAALQQYPGLPVLCSGGVASNRRLREKMAAPGALFAAPEYSTDNAMGVAILAHRAAQRGGRA